MSPAGDNSGSHRAGMRAAVQTPPARIPAAKRPAQPHADSRRPSAVQKARRAGQAAGRRAVMISRDRCFPLEACVRPGARRGRIMPRPCWTWCSCSGGAEPAARPGRADHVGPGEDLPSAPGRWRMTGSSVHGAGHMRGSRTRLQVLTWASARLSGICWWARRPLRLPGTPLAGPPAGAAGVTCPLDFPVRQRASPAGTSGAPSGPSHSLSSRS